MTYLNIIRINHGFLQSDVGSVFVYKNGAFSRIAQVEMTDRCYGNWTVLTKIFDAHNFACFSGEAKVIEMEKLHSPKNEELSGVSCRITYFHKGDRSKIIYTDVFTASWDNECMSFGLIPPKHLEGKKIRIIDWLFSDELIEQFYEKFCYVDMSRATLR